MLTFVRGGGVVLSWLLIYRTESYSSLQGKVEKLTKKRMHTPFS